MGENGAGKSTLMGILYGYYRPDRGEILVRGRPAAIRSPQDALAAGIGMVHQHFMLVEPFTVLENVVLGVEGGFRLGAGLARARAELERLGREYHLEVDPDARVADLGVGQRQRVEILKALYRGADLLILDEPTAVLTPQEADHLFRILRALPGEGKTVVLVTHKLREIRDVTDVVTVMRQGRIVATLPTAETTPEQLAELMVGRKVNLRVDKAPAQPGEPVLEVADLVVEDALGSSASRASSFAVRRGEIVGVAGRRGQWPVRAAGSARGHPAREIRADPLEGRGTLADAGPRSPRADAAARARPRARGPPAHGAHHALRRAGERHPRLSRRGDVQRRDPAPPSGGGQELPAPGRRATTSGPGTAPATPRPSRAATSRRSSWPASWTATPTSSWSASPPGASTSARSSSFTGGWWRSATLARRSSWSRSSWTRSSPWPTASSSCTAAGSSASCSRAAATERAIGLL